MSRKSEESASADESNSAEKMSTTDEVDSHNWSDEDESRDEFDLNNGGVEEDESVTDSRSDSESDTTGQDRLSPNAKNNGQHRVHKKGHTRRAGKRKRLQQSDTETRKLLDDIDVDEEDYAYLDEAKENSQVDPRLFEMSEEQIDYYTKFFLHLQRKTQNGHASLNGAVSGTDDGVVEFFRRSRLDIKSLSRVWALADVNEDGFLNHSEFMLAMHLIVLNLKGNVPVPNRLPSPVRPCITPTRMLQPVTNELQNSTASSTLSSTADNASTSRGSEPQANNSQVPTQHFRHFQPTQTVKPRAHFLQATSSYVDESTPKHQSLSDDHLHVHAQREAIIANFSDAPPVLVDSRPTALNVTPNSAGFALLNSLASRGPPPRPPQRQYNTNEAAKGHGRSASLDLNTLGSVSSQLQKPNASMFQSTTSSAGYHPTTLSIDESTSASPFMSNSAHFVFSQTPPVPLPSRQQQRTELQSRATQTEDEPKPSLDTETFTALLENSQKMSPAERCRVLRLYNAELENERATLAQIRLQLQLRLEEAEQALKSHGINVEPLASSPPAQHKPISVASPKPTTV